MPFLAALFAGLVATARDWGPKLIARVLVGLGVGFFTHSVAMPAIIEFIQGKVASLGAVLIAYFYALWIDKCITVIVSAKAMAAAGQLMFKKLG